jgi:flagellar hook protein FlgE
MALGSFAASLSGLYANQQKLGVIGNNLANINTVAFKGSNVEFADLVSQSIGGSGLNPMQIGLGVGVGSIMPNFSQGGIEGTGVATHLAIQGAGFFVVGDPTQRAFTRAGNFAFDATGTLVTADGLPVQGYTTIDPVTGLVVTTGQPTNIVIPPGVLREPAPTTQFGMFTNLDAAAAVGDTFTSSVQIYDALGVAHVATVTYTKTGPNAWSYAMTVPGDEVNGGVPGTPFQIATGTLQFDGTGTLIAVNGVPPADVTITSPSWINGATPTNFVWDIVDPANTPLLTGYGAPSATSSTSQNGSPAGAVTGIALIDPAGQIVVSFGGGRTAIVGQLAMANFNSPEGLVKHGANLYGVSEASGEPSYGVARTGGRGSLIWGALEQSNVDIAHEFTQMILAQRGYQANSKSITTADELLVDTLNIKR